MKPLPERIENLKKRIETEKTYAWRSYGMYQKHKRQVGKMEATLFRWVRNKEFNDINLPSNQG